MVPRTALYRAARNTTFPWGIWKAGIERNADPTDPRVVAAVETGQLVPLEPAKVKRTRKATAPRLVGSRLNNIDGIVIGEHDPTLPVTPYQPGDLTPAQEEALGIVTAKPLQDTPADDTEVGE